MQGHFHVRCCRRVKASKSKRGISHHNVRDIRCKYPADRIDMVSPRSVRCMTVEQWTAVCLMLRLMHLQCTAVSGPNNLSLFKPLQQPGNAGARSSAKLVPCLGDL